MKTAANRIDYFDFLRTIAIFFVILIHCTAPEFTSLPINSRSWLASNVFESISRFAVPIFVMISGALNLSKDRDIKTFFKKNVLKIAIILFSWNLIYSVIGLAQGSSLSTFVYSLIAGHYHLWFLYMLLGLYILTPFLKTMLSDQKRIKLFLIISFLFGIALPGLANILNILPYHFTNVVGSGLDRILNIVGFGNLIGYSFYYVLGYYLHFNNLKPKTRKILYSAGAICIFFTFFATWGASIITHTPNVKFLIDLAINNAVISAAIFVFAKHHTFKTCISKVLIRISKYSLGIYVTHAIILENILIYLPSMPIALDIVVKAISCFVICLVLVFCLQKIPFLKKIV